MKHAILRPAGRIGRLMASGAAGALLTLGALGAGTAASASQQPPHGGFNTNGDILIADQFNNRVVEVNRHHQVVWHFGNGSSVPGPHSIVGTNDAERVGGLTLISGTGTPARGRPVVPQPQRLPG